MEQLTQFIEFGLLWLIYLVFQALFICGIKLSSEGSTEVLPDGSQRHSEMILYPIKKFLLQKNICKIFYTGDQFHDMLEQIKNSMVSLSNISYTMIAEREAIRFDEAFTEAIFKKVRPSLEKNFEIGFAQYTRGAQIYKNISTYRFSKWIRKPVIECVKCMASFYGIFTFLIPVSLLFGWIAFPAYVVNTFCLVCVNPIIYKKA